MADTIVQTLQAISELLTQAQRAETSLDFRGGIVGAQLRSVQERGIRELSMGGVMIRMHALAILDEDGKTRDIMFCRTPELAKFIAMLLRHGEAPIAGFYKSLQAMAATSSREPL